MTVTKTRAEELHNEIQSAADRLQDAVEAFEAEWEALRKLLAEAQADNIWEVLDYPSWPAYCVEAIGLNPTNVEERRLLVALLVNEAGLSTRAIAAMLGVSHDTVWRDIGKVSDLLTLEDHATVHSLDGVERPRQQENPTNKRDRKKPDVPPKLLYVKTFNAASEDVSKLIDRIDNDPEIKQEAAKELDHLVEMRDNLSAVIKKLRKVRWPVHTPELEA